jgi:hypothetical protein
MSKRGAAFPHSSSSSSSSPPSSDPAGGGGGGKKGRGEATGSDAPGAGDGGEDPRPPPPTALTAASIERLANDVKGQLLAFMPQGDAGSLMQVSKGLRDSIASLIRTLKLPYRRNMNDDDFWALARLLQRAENLERLDATSSNAFWYAEGALTRSIRRSSACSKLHSLGLAARDVHWWTSDLTDHLGPGTFPSLTGLEGLGGGMHIWTIFPPDRVTHLEAKGIEQCNALGGYMLQHPNFAALRSIKLLDVNLGSDSTVNELKGVLQALAQGHAPVLQELQVWKWHEQAAGLLLAQLGQIIHQGRLPGLCSLTLAGGGLQPGDFAAVLDGLGQHQRLRRLHVEIKPSAADPICLAAALQVSGGLGALQELHVRAAKYHHLPGEWDPVLLALAADVPCARTLRALTLGPGCFSDDALRSFMASLRSNHFSTLQSLNIDGGSSVKHGLPMSLLALANEGAPSRLKHLVFSHPRLTTDFLDALTPVFQAGGLPDLVTLEIEGDMSGGTAFIEAWRALGPIIKLEQLRLFGSGLVTPGLRVVLHEALTDPAFCPFLRSPPLLKSRADWRDGRWKEEEAAFERRRRKREDAAIMEGKRVEGQGGRAHGGAGGVQQGAGGGQSGAEGARRGVEGTHAADRDLHGGAAALKRDESSGDKAAAAAAAWRRRLQILGRGV